MEINTDQLTQLLREQIEKFDGSVDVAEVGEVIEVGDGVARVSGLENVMSSELVELPNGIFGMALNLEEDNVGLVLFGESRMVKEGDLAKRTGHVVEVPVGDAMLGRVVNPLGQPIDGKGPIDTPHTLPIERKALELFYLIYGICVHFQIISNSLKWSLLENKLIQLQSLKILAK